MDACAALRDKLTEIKGLGPAAQYGLFLADEDPKRGVWLDSGRTLEHYLLRENVSVQELFAFSSISCCSALNSSISVVFLFAASLVPAAGWLRFNPQPPAASRSRYRC